MRKTRLLILSICLSFLTNLQAQLPSERMDSIYQHIAALPPAERVKQTNQNFYQLYSKDFVLADRLATEAVTICREQGWIKESAVTLKNLGIVKFLQGNYEAALSAYQESLEIFNHLEDAGGQCSVCNELGVFFSKQEEYARAVSYLEQAAGACQSVGDSLGWSNALDNRGLIYLKNGDLEAAAEKFREVVSLRKIIADTLGLTYVYNNLAAVATEQGRIEAAINYLQLSTQYRRKLNDRQGVAININNMGEIYLAANDPLGAIPFFEESLEESRSLKFTDLERHILDMLAQANEAAGEHEAALAWIRKSYHLKDSLFNLDRSAQIAEMQEKYETEKKEKELSQQQLIIRKRSTWLAVAIIGILSLVIILILVTHQQRQRRTQIQKEASLRESLLLREGENQLQQERLRISRDLHDHLGAELSLIRSGIARQLFDPQQPVNRTALQAVSGHTQKAMEELRETIWAIRGDGGSVQELAEKLQDFAGRFENIQLEVKLDATASLSLSPGQTLNLYRIFQEAIHNSIKYAPGTCLQLSFKQQETNLQVLFSDGGPGFMGQTENLGYGLQNMQERAREIKADFQLDTGPEGTKIILSLPLQYL